MLVVSPQLLPKQLISLLDYLDANPNAVSR
jgi:hypothetical protein